MTIKIYTDIKNNSDINNDINKNTNLNILLPNGNRKSHNDLLCKI